MTRLSSSSSSNSSSSSSSSNSSTNTNSSNSSNSSSNNNNTTSLTLQSKRNESVLSTTPTSNKKHRISVGVTQPLPTATTPRQNATGSTNSSSISEKVNKTNESDSLKYDERIHLPCEKIISELNSKLIQTKKECENIQKENFENKSKLTKSTDDIVSLSTELSIIKVELINTKSKYTEDLAIINGRFEIDKFNNKTNHETEMAALELDRKEKEMSSKAESDAKAIRIQTEFVEEVTVLKTAIGNLEIKSIANLKKIYSLFTENRNNKDGYQNEIESLQDRFTKEMAEVEKINANSLAVQELFIAGLNATANGKNQKKQEQDIKHIRETANLRYQILMLEQEKANSKLAASATLEADQETVAQLVNVTLELNR